MLYSVNIQYEGNLLSYAMYEDGVFCGKIIRLDLFVKARTKLGTHGHYCVCSTPHELYKMAKMIFGKRAADFAEFHLPKYLKFSLHSHFPPIVVDNILNILESEILSDIKKDPRYITKIIAMKAILFIWD